MICKVHCFKTTGYYSEFKSGIFQTCIIPVNYLPVDESHFTEQWGFFKSREGVKITPILVILPAVLQCVHMHIILTKGQNNWLFYRIFHLL